MSEIGLNLWLLLLLCLFVFSDDCWRRRIGKGNSGAKNLRHKSKSFHEDMHQLKERERETERKVIQGKERSCPSSLSLIGECEERGDKKGLRDSDDWRYLSEPLLDEEHELLFALVGHFHVFNELAELHQTVVSQKERLTSFGQKVDKIAVVTWTDVRQS